MSEKLEGGAESFKNKRIDFLEAKHQQELAASGRDGKFSRLIKNTDPEKIVNYKRSRKYVPKEPKEEHKEQHPWVEILYFLWDLMFIKLLF